MVTQAVYHDEEADDQPEPFKPLLPRDIGVTLPNLPSPHDFSHPSSNYSKQNDARICSEFVFLSMLSSTSNSPILAEKMISEKILFAIPLLHRYAVPNNLRQLISSTGPHTTFPDHATLNELTDDDLYLLSLCQDTTISKPHDPNPHKLKGPMKDTPLLSVTHDTMSPALQFHFTWNFLSPRDRVNTVNAWPAVMHPYT